MLHSKKKGCRRHSHALEEHLGQTDGTQCFPTGYVGWVRRDGETSRYSPGSRKAFQVEGTAWLEDRSVSEPQRMAGRVEDSGGIGQASRSRGLRPG